MTPTARARELASTLTGQSLRALLVLGLLLLPAPLRAAVEGDVQEKARRGNAARAEQDFVAASELALKGDTKAAIDLYRTILEQGIDSADLEYDLGNAYAQAGQLPQAVVAYERALRLAPDDRDARANLEVVRRRLGVSVEKAPPGKETGGQGGGGQVVLADLVEPLVAPLSVQPFAWLAVVFEFVFFAALIGRRRSGGGPRRRKMTILAAVSLLLLLASGSVVAGHAVVARDPRAVVMESVDLKEGPHSRFKPSGHVGAGARVRILSTDAGWAQVLQEDGTSGWVPEKTLTRV